MPEGLHPLVEGHNRLSEQRINLVFVRHDFPEDLDWVSLSRDMLTWDGPVMIGDDGPVDNPADAYDLTYGPFAIEPYRSYRELFNVWYLDQPAPSPVAWGAAGEPFPIELPNRLVVHLAWDWPHGAAAAVPRFVPPQLPDPGSDTFVGLTMGVNIDGAHYYDGILAHELGHAVFNLADKYVFDQNGFDGRSNYTFFPACASGPDEAEEFFGDLVGTVDPFFDEYLAQRAASGVDFGEFAPTEDELRDLITVGYIDNGCFGPERVAIRSTAGGLMYDESALPVMGAVNRRWAELVLDTWSTPR